MSVIYGECERKGDKWDVVSELKLDKIELMNSRQTAIQFVPSSTFEDWKRVSVEGHEDVLPVIFMENLLWPGTWYQMIVFPSSHRDREEIMRQIKEDVCGEHIVGKWLDELTPSQYEKLRVKYID